MAPPTRSAFTLAHAGPDVAAVEWVRAVVSAACRGVPVEVSRLPADLDTATLLSYAERHALVPLLAWHLGEQRRIDVLGAELEEALTVGLRASMARSLSQLDELRRLIADLEAAGIEVLPWKGPLLSERLFGEAGVRECADLDLLIAPAALSTAQQNLESMGYRCYDFGKVRARWNEDHCVAWEHADRPVAVELHTRLFPRSFAFPLSVDELPRAGAVLRSDGGSAPPCLAVEAELLLLCAHAAKHLWDRLAWVADIARLLTVHSGLEAGSLRDLADRSRCRRAVQMSLRLSEDLLGVSPSDAVAQAFDEPADRAWLARRSRLHVTRLLDPQGDEAPSAGVGAWLQLQRLRAGTREAWRDRLRVYDCALRYALAPNDNDRTCIPGLRLPTPLAMVCRPIRLLAKLAFRE